ncbi:MAG: hypothetical protein EOM67_06510 [Spirochaetia bacterium]|nr:hypothetical protein [Spirochaetia bacterium]
MKKIVVISLLVVCSLLPLSSIDMGFTVSTFSGSPSLTLINDGMYGSVGFLAGLAPRIEFETTLVGQVTPHPFTNLLIKSSISFALLSPLYNLEEKDHLYLNMFIGIGVIAPLSFNGSWGPYITFTPLATGGPQFLRKERVVTLSLYYDVPTQGVGFFFQLFTLDFYF